MKLEYHGLRLLSKWNSCTAVIQKVFQFAKLDSPFHNCHHTIERVPANSFNTNWETDEPADAVGSDCAYLAKTSGYKMKTDNCKASKPFLCTPITPICPDGYEHVPGNALLFWKLLT